MRNSIKSTLKSLILPVSEIDQLLPRKGKILDLGCGEGVITILLAKEKNREVIGIDNNSDRLPKATRKNLLFKKADITKLQISKIDGALLSDVLHHVNFAYQAKIIKKVYKNLQPTGILIIKEIDTEERLRSRLSRIWDFILYPRETVYFRKSSDLKKQLQNIGFKVKIIRPLRFFPGSITLFICTT